MATDTQSLLDWFTNLARDPGARTAFEEDPQRFLQESGLEDVTPQDVADVLPQVLDAAGAAALVSPLPALAPGATQLESVAEQIQHVNDLLSHHRADTFHPHGGQETGANQVENVEDPDADLNQVADGNASGDAAADDPAAGDPLRDAFPELALDPVKETSAKPGDGDQANGDLDFGRGALVPQDQLNADKLGASPGDVGDDGASSTGDEIAEIDIVGSKDGDLVAGDREPGDTETHGIEDSARPDGEPTHDLHEDFGEAIY